MSFKNPQGVAQQDWRKFPKKTMLKNQRGRHSKVLESVVCMFFLLGYGSVLGIGLCCVMGTESDVVW